MENQKDNSNEMDLEKYVMAVQTAIEKAPLRADNSVDISDIWVITSLPIDLIMECLKKPQIQLSPKVSKVTFNKKTILKNQGYLNEPLKGE